MLETTVAGSLPKPSWLAEPEKLWAPWRLEGEELEQGKCDATLIWLKEQEDAGIDVASGSNDCLFSGVIWSSTTNRRFARGHY